MKMCTKNRRMQLAAANRAWFFTQLPSFANVLKLVAAIIVAAFTINNSADNIGACTQMPFATNSISFWRSYYRTDDFCGSWFSENYIEIVLLSIHSLATNHGCGHNSQPSTCTTDIELIVTPGSKYVHSTQGAILCLGYWHLLMEVFQLPSLVTSAATYRLCLGLKTNSHC